MSTETPLGCVGPVRVVGAPVTLLGSITIGGAVTVGFFVVLTVVVGAAAVAVVGGSVVSGGSVIACVDCVGTVAAAVGAGGVSGGVAACRARRCIPHKMPHVHSSPAISAPATAAAGISHGGHLLGTAWIPLGIGIPSPSFILSILDPGGVCQLH